MSNSIRLLKALSKRGLDVQQHDNIYEIKLTGSASPPATVLLPADLPVESKAFEQLAQVAALQHPSGGHVTQALATPDFHPGDSGVAIGTVAAVKGAVFPQLVGDDINCGMRLHSTDIPLDSFACHRNQLVSLLKGDFFAGTRDLPQTGATQYEMFENGLPGWLETSKASRLGSLAASDFSQIENEIYNHVYCQGSHWGSANSAPQDLVPLDSDRIIRDDGLATIGGGNHFVEIEVVDEIYDRVAAYHMGLRLGCLTFMVHSGSRFVGKYIGGLWVDKARKAWPKDLRYPESKLFGIPDNSPLYDGYLRAEGTAANYGYVNRLLLAELVRLRMRQVWRSEIEAPLVYDLPHNITLFEYGQMVVRKGACPAHDNQPVLIPGSMGAGSYVLMGLGNKDWLSSASHGAGRLHSRGEMRHVSDLGLSTVDCVSLREERLIEESPAAYKPITPVIEAQVSTGIVSKVARLRPILTFKA